jgi:hypothetical protein
MDQTAAKGETVLSFNAKLILLALCFTAISACSSIPNTHLHNAVPKPAFDVRSSLGLSSASNIYKYQVFSPAAADSFVSGKSRREIFAQTPLNYSIGIGKNYSVGAQLAFFLGPKFKSEIYHSYMSDTPSIKPSFAGAYYGKMHLQKSIPLGRDCYLAAFPAYGYGAGVEGITTRSKLRYRSHSVELPITFSKQIKLASGKQLVLSGTARSALDTTSSDLSLIEPGNMNYDFYYYYDQPGLETFRNALMAHLDYDLQHNLILTIQLGMEHIHANERRSWEPVIYLGWGKKVILKAQR